MFSSGRSKKSAPKHIIFDLIGVLFQINTFKLLRSIGLLRTARYLLTHRKHPIKTYLKTLDVLARQEKLTSKHIKYKKYLQPLCVAQCSLGFKTMQETARSIKNRIRQLSDQFFASVTERALMMHICELCFNPEIIRNTRPNNKLFELIRSFAREGKHKLFLLTNIDAHTFEQLTKAYRDVFCLFDGVVASCNVHLVKPQPEIYQHLLDQHGLDAQQCVFIDDQQENLLAAQKLGIAGIHYTTFETVRKKLSDCGIL